MPPLTFYPQHERHLTFAAISHCARDYKLTREVAQGTRPGKPAGTSLLIGIGADKLVGELWRQTQRGEPWNAGVALEAARSNIEAEGVGNVAWESDRAAILAELSLLARDYISQWKDVRPWEVLHIDAVEQDPLPERLIISRDLGRCTYLTMPDMECRQFVPGVMLSGYILIVDRKTGKYPYNPTHWAWEPQMLTYCLAAEAHYKEPIAFQIDYMQRPSKRLQAWTLPVTFPFPFNRARRALATSWLAHQQSKIDHYHHQADQVARGEAPDLAEGHEPWPRDPAMCRTPYGRCCWEEECFGTSDTADTDD